MGIYCIGFRGLGLRVSREYGNILHRLTGNIIFRTCGAEEEVVHRVSRSILRCWVPCVH